MLGHLQDYEDQGLGECKRRQPHLQVSLGTCGEDRTRQRCCRSRDGEDGKQRQVAVMIESLVPVGGVRMREEIAQPVSSQDPSRYEQRLCDASTSHQKVIVTTRTTRPVAIITTAANEDVAPLHDRMPALLRREEWGSWLDRRGRDPDRLRPLLEPSPSGSLVPRAVSRRVNDARNDDPALLSA